MKKQCTKETFRHLNLKFGLHEPYKSETSFVANYIGAIQCEYADISYAELVDGSIIKYKRETRMSFPLPISQ